MTEKIRIKEPNVNFLKPLFALERFGIAFRTNSGVNKTHLYLVTKLRWDSFNNYLNWLVSKDFIQYRRDEKIENYYLTENGRKMLTILATFNGLIR